MNNFYHNGAPVLKKDLEEIESIEDEKTGEILKRFVIAGLKDSPIFTEPNKQKIEDQLYIQKWKDQLLRRRYTEYYYATSAYVSPFPVSWISCDIKIT